MKNKILIIAYPFPPIPYSGTYRVLRLCKGLANKNTEIHVVSIKIDKRIPNDYELLSFLPSEVRIHRTHIIDPWQRYQALKNNKIKFAGITRYLIKFYGFIIRLITIPDHQIFWLPFAFFKALKIIKKNKIKNVLISSPPVSSLLIGCLLTKVADINFFADLRDPIVGNIAQVNLINPKGFLNKFTKYLLGFIEKTVVKCSDTVINNTQTHNKEMIDKYNLNKFITIRNAFDEDDYKGIHIQPYDKFTISHLGGIYGLRKAGVLFKAVKKMEKRFLPDALNLQLLFVGSCDNSFRQSVTDYGVEKYTKIVSRVPHREAIQIMASSHLLLLVKATGKGSLGQIPAKFFEYVGTKNSIICLGSPKSEVADLINTLNIGLTVEKDVEILADFLENSYRKFLKHEVVLTGHNAINDFNCERMTNRFLKLIFSNRNF